MKKNQRVFIILGIFFVVLLVLFTIILFVIKRENAEEKEINRENEIKNTCYLTVLFDEDILDEEIQEIGVEISEMKGRRNEHTKIWYNSTSIYDNKLIIEGTLCSWKKSTRHLQLISYLDTTPKPNKPWKEKPVSVPSLKGKLLW